jgi:hypothetical protein
MSKKGFYNVAFSYEYTTISIGVEAFDEDEATQEALAIVVEEWGAGTRDYYSCDVEEIG